MAARKAREAAEDPIAMPFVERRSVEAIALDVREATTPSYRLQLRAGKQRGAMTVMAMRLRDPKLGDLQRSSAGAREEPSVDLGCVPIAEEDVERRADLAGYERLKSASPRRTASADDAGRCARTVSITVS
jgi:hypothetical protein